MPPKKTLLNDILYGPNPSGLPVDTLTNDEVEKLTYASEFHRNEQEMRLYAAQADQAEQELRNSRSELISNRVFTFTGGVSAAAADYLIDTLGAWANQSDKPITLVINSPGGYVVEGLAIYDFLRSLSARGIHITTVGLGYVASMGGVLLQAGDTRLMAKHAWLLIHEVSGVNFGKTSEMEDELKFTKRLQDQCLSILAERS